MDNKNLLIEEIEKYLFGEMGIDEVIEFERKLKNDENLLKFTETHAELLDAFAKQNKRNAFIKKLQLSHNSVENDKTKKLKISIPAETQKLPATRFLLMAAAVALVISVSSILVYQQFNDSIKPSAYKALRREIDTIKKSQNRIINNIDKEKESSIFGGTGFAVSPNGYIITGYHVVKGGDSVFLENSCYSKLYAKVVAVDPDYDIALLQVQDKNFGVFEKLPFALKNRIAEIGEKVYTLGYPKDDIVYGEGSISSVTGFNSDSLSYQVSIPINPGNSGGPLIDEKGNVIGLISGKQTEKDAAGFAVKTQKIVELMDKTNEINPENPAMINKYNQLNQLNRTQQIKRMQDFVFNVKVYKNN